ncbi:MAG: hypothetical protein WC812_02420 [Candidatus Pacearchaeota archaeon]|jgi:hypothetical protein
MKFYISSRTSKLDEVKRMYKKLKNHGHEVIFDWTKKSSLKPYSKNEILIQKYSYKVIKSIINSDVYVLLGDSGGTDMYGELASAITSKEIFGKPLIYLIGEKGENSIFPFHKFVKHKSSIEEILEDIKIN